MAGLEHDMAFIGPVLQEWMLSEPPLVNVLFGAQSGHPSAGTGLVLNRPLW